MDIDTDFSGIEAVALAGALLTGIAAFLPWVTAGVSAGPIEVEASSTGIEGLGVLTLLLAIVVVATLLLAGLEEWGPPATTVAGLVIAAVGVWKIVDIEGAVSPGIGLYLTVLGGLAVLIAGAWAFRDGTEATAGRAE